MPKFCILVKTNITVRKNQHLLPAKFRSKLNEQCEPQSVHSVQCTYRVRSERISIFLFLFSFLYSLRFFRQYTGDNECTLYEESATNTSTLAVQSFAPIFNMKYTFSVFCKRVCDCARVCDCVSMCVAQAQHNFISVWRKLFEK